MDLYMIFFIVTFLILIFSIVLNIKRKDELSIALFENKEILQEYNGLKLEYAVLKTRYEDELSSSKEKLEILKNAKDELNKEFKLLANKIFEDKSKQFSHIHKEKLEILLKPFREQISNFSAQSREQFNQELKDRHLLKDELHRLKEMNSQLSFEALNLIKALKGENKTQGNWGEIILERTLEESGLRQGVEYELQSTLKSKDEKVYRPDVVIHMPQNRDIVIDSKVSLVSYERYISEDRDDLKAVALKEHLASISRHVKELSTKNYDNLKGINTLDYVLLFIPIEGAFMLALQKDGEFFKRAYDSNILVVSPSTLLVTLRTIEHIWRTQRQQDHAMKIANEAEAMYEKLVAFVDEMQKVGTHLQKAQDSYEISMKRLKSGRGNIIKRAENIVELGIKPKKLLDVKSQEEL